jgi:F-type H+-transporting ATPase subunit b
MADAPATASDTPVSSQDMALAAGTDSPAASTLAEAGHEAPHETFLGLDSYAWVGLAFLAFLLLLWRIGAFAMITKALDGQALKVKSDLAEAAALKAEAQAMKDRAAAEAVEAETTAKAMLANAELEARRIVEQATVDADTAIARRTRLAEDRIAAEVRGAEAELRARAADITVKAAQGLLATRSKELAGLTDAAIAGLDRR